MHLAISVLLSLPRATDTVGCVFMALALMRELTVVISLGWLRGLMSIFTASKTKGLCVIGKLFKKWGFICSLFLNPAFGEGFLLVKHDIHPIFNGAQLFTKNIRTALSKCLIIEHFSESWTLCSLLF